MRTLKLTLAYDGTNYVGWQRQAVGPSIQQCVEDALVPFMHGAGPAPSVAGAGRTDAGVHALGQVASVNVAFDHLPEAIGRALNVRLPPDIRVREIVEASSGFHARFDARGKRYRYRIVTAPVLLPFDRWYAWHAPGRYDAETMRRAASVLVGRHDFASFQAQGSDAERSVRTLDRVEIVAEDDGFVIDLAGDGFLRHMVRTIAGTLVEIGAGVRAADAMPAILAARDRQAAGRTAPAWGLTLMEVWY